MSGFGHHIDDFRPGGYTLTVKLLLLLIAASSADYSLPPSWTPGAINPNVTQANIKTTICAASWTKAVRPPVSFTDSLKLKQMVDLRLITIPESYEEDHRVPLEVGGAPQDPKNLWPQIWPEARQKDRLETAVKKDVCSGRLTLAQGQAIFLGDFWQEYARRFGK